jgi:tetratricopeptide (TPR) repeat protein
VLVGLIATAVIGHEYGLPRYRAYQERQYAQQADLWLKKGDLQRAIFRARQTLGLNPSNAIATRVFGNVADSWNSPQALYWRQRAVWLMPDATNRLALASTALRFESFPFPSANKALSELSPETRGTPTFHLIAGAMAVKLNNLPEADRHYSEALRLDPTNPAAKLSLAVVRLHANEEKIIADSRTVLELLRTDRSVGLLALRSLVADSLNHRELGRAEELSQQVLVNTQSSFSDRIVHLAILHAAKSDKLDEFLRETQAKTERNVKAIGEVAAWMNSAGRSRQVLEWLNNLPAEQRLQGFIPILIADCHASLGAWNDLESYLLSGGWPGLDHIRFAMLAMTGWKQTGEVPSTTWRLAVREASRSSQGLSTVAELASAWGWRRESEETTWEAAERFPNQPWPLDRLDRLYTNRRDTEGLRRVYAARLERNPEDRLAHNNYAMVSLLLDKEAARAVETAADLHASDPKSPVFSSTHAFSLHLQGRTKDGIAVFRALPLEKLDDPALGLYYGVLLVADGQKELAQGYLKRAAKAFMLPEEKALLDQALAQ